MLVLEYGGSDRSLWIQMPTALSIPMNMERYDWRYYTEPEPHLNGRRLHTPRGKVLGGSSSINGLVYVRGNPLDFERWQEEGAAGWGYHDVLPYFRRAERRAGGGDEYRGADGPLGTRQGLVNNPLHAAWLAAGREAGYPRSADMNGFQQEGFGAHGHDGGRRPARERGQCLPAARHAPRQPDACAPRALATRVLFEGRRAVGVAYLRGGVRHEVRARREVMLSAGSINSPQLLKLSGVGPAAELGEHGIAVVQDLPGVGENLQDHLEFYFQVASREPVTLYAQMSLLRRALIGARWLLRHDGLGASNHFETGGFIRSRAGVRYPDIQFHFLPAGGELRRLGARARARLPGARRPDALAQPRLGAAALARPARQAAHPVQLHVLSRGLDRDARLRASDARDLRASRPSSVIAAARSSPGRRYRAMPRSTRSCATRWRAPITPRAPAAWGVPPTGRRWSTTRRASSACRACAWSTPPSCPRSRPATSTPRPSWWPRRPPITSAAYPCCRAPAPRTTSPPGGSAASARLAVRRCSAC